MVELKKDKPATKPAKDPGAPMSIKAVLDQYAQLTNMLIQASSKMDIDLKAVLANQRIFDKTLALVEKRMDWFEKQLERLEKGREG